MELPMRFLVLLLLAVIVLLAIFAGLIGPINTGAATTQNISARNSACSNWSLEDCKDTSGRLAAVKTALSCANADECRNKCSAMGFCL